MIIQNLFLFIATNVRTMSIVGGFITQTGTMSAAGNATSRFTHKVAQGTYSAYWFRGGAVEERHWSARIRVSDVLVERVFGQQRKQGSRAGMVQQRRSCSATFALQTSCNVQSLLWILRFVNATPGLRTQVLPLMRPGFFQLSQGGPSTRVRHL